MKKFIVKNPSNEVKALAYNKFIKSLISLKSILNDSDLDIYALHECQHDLNFTQTHKFAYELMLDLKLNVLSCNDVILTKLKDGRFWGYIQSEPIHAVYKNHYENKYIQQIYDTRLGWEK